jgi:hypothetical protein
MSDLRSDGSLLSSLHDFHTPYNDEISEISSSSSSSSSTNDEEKTRHIHQPRTGENFENVYQKQQPVMRIKQEEIIDQASPSRLRAQRNIKKSIATEQVHSAAPSTFLSFVVLRFLFFGFLYLLAGTIFYIYHEDWSLLTSLYFIFLSGPPSPPPPPPPACLSHDQIVCRIGLKDVAPQNGGRQPHTHSLSSVPRSSFDRCTTLHRHLHPTWSRLSLGDPPAVSLPLDSRQYRSISSSFLKFPFHPTPQTLS